MKFSNPNVVMFLLPEKFAYHKDMKAQPIKKLRLILIYNNF